MALLTEQMSAWQGLKKFGTAGADAGVYWNRHQ